MRQTRASSRPASVGPFAQAQAPRCNPRPAFMDDVIVLTDSSDDERPARPPTKKRQRVHVPNTVVNPIDLTEPEADLSHVYPPLPVQNNELRHDVDGALSFLDNDIRPGAAGSSKQSSEGPAEKHNEVLKDLTNAWNVSVAPELPQQDSVVNPIYHYVCQVLDVIPDVQPEHVATLVSQHLPVHGDRVVEIVLHVLFEVPTYPKVERNKGKRKRDDGTGEHTAKVVKKDYASKERDFVGGPYYFDIALVNIFL